MAPAGAPLLRTPAEPRAPRPEEKRLDAQEDEEEEEEEEEEDGSTSQSAGVHD